MGKYVRHLRQQLLDLLTVSFHFVKFYFAKAVKGQQDAIYKTPESLLWTG